MALNREQKRALKKQGAIDDEGQPTRGPRGAPEPKGKSERTGVLQFLREVRAELRKVVWPSREEVINYSIVVFIVVVVLTAAIAGLDYLFGEAIFKLFGR